MDDMQKVLLPVGADNPTAWATKIWTGGPWSLPGSWANGSMPGDKDAVYAVPGADVDLDVKQTPLLSALRIAGNFTHRPDIDIQLLCETFVSDSMAATITLDNSQAGGGTFEHIILDSGPINYSLDLWARSRGFISMGMTSFTGRQKDIVGWTNGTPKGAQTTTLQAPMAGLSIGDAVVFPGTGHYSSQFGLPQGLVIDDDTAVVTSISADGLTIGFSPATAWDHLPDPDMPTPLYNYSARSIHFTSQNTTDRSRMGHLMLMCGNMFTLTDVSSWDCGRMTAFEPLTDPDGTGPGPSVLNPRGTYGGWHVHRNGVSPQGPQGFLTRCVCVRPGKFGHDNHSSNVRMDTCFSGWAEGTGIVVGEAGDENGLTINCHVVRTLAPFSTVPEDIINDGGNGNWGTHGHGLHWQGGSPVVKDCYVSGASHAAYGIVALGLQIPGQAQTVCLRQNLPNQNITTLPSFPPGIVPQLHSGLKAYGSSFGLIPWGLNGDTATPGFTAPTIGVSEFTDSYFRTAGLAVDHGYEAFVNMRRVRTKAIYANWSWRGSFGFGHSGFGRSQNYYDCEADGYACGIEAPTGGDNTISNFTHNCLTGIKIFQATNEVHRSITITGLQGSVIPDSVLAGILGYQPNSDFGLQGRKQVDYHLRLDGPGSTFYQDARGFLNYLQNLITTPADDVIMADGKQLFFPEMAADWQFSNAPGCIPQLKTLTGAQAQSQYGIAVGAKVLPVDAVRVPRLYGLTSSNPAVNWPKLFLNKNALSQQFANWQQTNLTNNFFMLVQDSNKNWVYAPPTNPTPGWNIVVIPSIDGLMRGEVVLCDPTTTPPAPWDPPFPPPPSGPPVIVPNVVGLSFTQAQAALTGLGLVIIPASVPDPTQLVLTQSPAALASVPAGTTVIVTVAVPPSQVVVPSFNGQDQATATATAQAAGLVPVFAFATQHAQSQSPAAGISVPKGSDVTINMA